MEARLSFKLFLKILNNLIWLNTRQIKIIRPNKYLTFIIVIRLLFYKLRITCTVHENKKYVEIKFYSMLFLYSLLVISELGGT